MVGIGEGNNAILNISGRPSAIFDGIDDKVVFNNLIIPPEEFTVMFWMLKRSTPVANTRFMDIQDGGPTNGFTFVAPGGVETTVQCAFRNGSTTEAALNTPVTANDTWHHYAVSYKQDDARLYLDGVLVDSDSAVTMTPSSAQLTLASRAAGSNKAHILMNELRIFNEIVSADNIAAIYSGDVSYTKGLKSYVPLISDYNDHVGPYDGVNTGSRLGILAVDLSNYMTNTRTNADDTWFLTSLNYNQIMPGNIRES